MLFGERRLRKKWIIKRTLLLQVLFSLGGVLPISFQRTFHQIARWSIIYRGSNNLIFHSTFEKTQPNLIPCHDQWHGNIQNPKCSWHYYWNLCHYVISLHFYRRFYKQTKYWKNIYQGQVYIRLRKPDNSGVRLNTGELICLCGITPPVMQQ